MPTWHYIRTVKTEVLFITKILNQACLLGKKIWPGVVPKINNILLNERLQTLRRLDTKKDWKVKYKMHGICWLFPLFFHPFRFLSDHEKNSFGWLQVYMRKWSGLDDWKYYFLNYCAQPSPRSRDLKAEGVAASQNKCWIWTMWIVGLKYKMVYMRNCLSIPLLIWWKDEASSNFILAIHRNWTAFHWHTIQSYSWASDTM